MKAHNKTARNIVDVRVQRIGGSKQPSDDYILEERVYNGRTIVLGKDPRQHMVGIRYGKGMKVNWVKFFTDLPPADKYGGQYGLAKAYFDDPDKFPEFGRLPVEENENVVEILEKKTYKHIVLVLGKDRYSHKIGYMDSGSPRYIKFFTGSLSKKRYEDIDPFYDNYNGKPYELAKRFFDNPTDEEMVKRFGKLRLPVIKSKNKHKAGD